MRGIDFFANGKGNGKFHFKEQGKRRISNKPQQGWEGFTFSQMGKGMENSISKFGNRRGMEKKHSQKSGTERKWKIDSKIQKREGNEKIHFYDSGTETRGFHSRKQMGTSSFQQKKYTMMNPRWIVNFQTPSMHWLCLKVIPKWMQGPFQAWTTAILTYPPSTYLFGVYHFFIIKKYIFCDEKLSTLQARKSTSRNNLIFSNTNWFCLKHWDQDQLLVEPFAIFPVDDRLEICQKNYMTGFLDPKLYTLKVRKLRLFLLKKKQRKCISLVTFL